MKFCHSRSLTAGSGVAYSICLLRKFVQVDVLKYPPYYKASTLELLCRCYHGLTSKDCTFLLSVLTSHSDPGSRHDL